MQFTETEQERQLSPLLLSSLVSRIQPGSTSYNGLRDVWEALGYPRDGSLRFDHFWLKYKRQDVAAAVIEKPVEGSWRQFPKVRGKEDNGKLQGQWERLEKKLGIYRTLIRADIMSRIGEYSTVLLGYQDGAENLLDPVDSADDLLYLQPYLQKHSSIKKFVSDKNNERFGYPEIYLLQVDQSENKSFPTTIPVHHSRVLHIADQLCESNVYGLPALEPIYNRLQDLELIVGGSAEMFWRGAFPGMAFSVKDGATLSDAGRVELEEEIQNYLHDFQRYLKVQGLDVEQLATDVTSPEKHVEVQLKAISIATGIPKRILEGSERGELASSQDAESWSNKCDTRRKGHVANNILRPLINRLGRKGVLDIPRNGFLIEWPDLEDQSDESRAKVGKDRTDAITKYADNPIAPLIVSHREFLLDIMELPAMKVDRIMEAVRAMYSNDNKRKFQ